MASPKGIDLNPEDSDMKFPAVSVVEELYPGTTKNFSVDSVSAGVAKSKELKEQAEARKNEKEKEREKERKDTAESFKSAIIISGVVVAVIGAIFAIAKKLRET